MSFIKMRKPASLSFDKWVLESIDKPFLLEQTTIALKAYENQTLWTHGGPLENLLGLAAEYAFEGYLETAGLKKEDYEWNKRRPSYWDSNSIRRPWDFRLSNGITFEIGAARPSHWSAVLKKADHKTQSDYFVQVKIEKLRCIGSVQWKGISTMVLFDADCKNPQIMTAEKDKAKQKAEELKDFAVVKIMGFDKISDITAQTNGWKLGYRGNLPTLYYDGWYKPIDQLRPVKELRKIVQESHIQ